MKVHDEDFALQPAIAFTPGTRDSIARVWPAAGELRGALVRGVGGKLEAGRRAVR